MAAGPSNQFYKEKHTLQKICHTPEIGALPFCSALVASCLRTPALRCAPAFSYPVKLFATTHLSPVVIEGNKIASSFWGKAWCDNLERYSDYANRLPRGRSYFRNRCVIDLQIASGEVTAQVSVSSLYRITITLAPLDNKAWRDICRDCSGSIDSMVELLQGRLSKAVTSAGPDSAAIWMRTARRSG